jgi:hypothetical protein
MGESIEVLALKDFRDASRREVHLSFQPRDDDPLMKTVDTRFSGTLGYEVEYFVSSSIFPSELPANENLDRPITSR